MKTDENIFLSVPKKVVLLQRSNHKRGMRTADKSCQPFLCLHSINRQVKRLVVCGSGNAHKGLRLCPEQHHEPLCLMFKKNAMNNNKRTAGETAMMGATYEERKNYMVQCLNESSTAILVYFDENCQIRTHGIAEPGYESALLSMLDVAAFRAHQLAEEVML